MNDDREYYKVLGLRGDEAIKEIKIIYRKLAKECHPDRNPDMSDEQFKAITEAYKVLTDETKRGQYDRGEYSDEIIDIGKRAISSIGMMFTQFIENPQVDVANTNLIELLRRQTKINEEKIRRKIEQMIKDIKRLKNIRGRTTGDILVNIVDQRIKAVGIGIKELDLEIKTIEKMNELYETYEYRVDELQEFTTITFGTMAWQGEKNVQRM